MGRTLRVLNVEDSERDMALLKRHLSRGGYDLVLDRVETAGAMRAALESQEWDIILCDYSMPHFSALSALRLLKEAQLDIPFIIISGTVGEAVAVEAMLAGANDYLMKDSLARLIPAIERELHEANNRRARAQAEESLRASEAELRAIFEAMPDLIIVFDADGRYLKVGPTNPDFLKDDDAANRIGKTLHELFPAERADPLLAHIRRTLIGRRMRRIEYNLEINGKEMWFDGSVSPMSDNTVVWIARDITQRKRIEQELSQSEERYRDIVENARDIIYTHDLNGNYTSVNKAGELLTGYTREEALSMNLSQTVAPDYMERARLMLAGKLVGEEQTVYDLDLISKDGRRIAVEVNTRLVFQNGAPVAVQGIARDITERKRAEEMQLRRAAHLALRADINAALADSSSGLRATLNRCTEAIVQHLGAAFARIWTLNKDEQALELQASAGLYTRIDGTYARVRVGTCKVGVVAAERQPLIANDIQRDPHIKDKEWARRESMTAFAGYPLVVEDRLVGVMAMFSHEKIADDTLDALSSVADIISQGIERKRVEEALRGSEQQLRQSQKLEAVGRLAGGVAHDFNNLLTVITGYSDLLLRQLEKNDPVRLKVEEIRKAGERAASLTRQLLAFSRKQVLQPRVLKLDAVVADVDKMLRRLIGEDIDLVTIAEPSLGQIKADPGQIEQVIVNLAVNARDAMPQGGKLTIETRNVYLDSDYVGQHLAVQSGHYVMLAVSDTGSGMTAETQARIFEPFFTTKEQGKGTGLGLSTVYGIVQQSGGSIWVYSEVGTGTVFKVYLPRVDEVIETEEVRGVSAKLPHGRETLLLVEDEEQVRRMTQMILEMNGYRVLEARGGDEAIRIYEGHEGEIDLVLTDVVMPGMSGRELARRLETLRPGIRVLYMSGYTDDAIVRHGLLDQEIAFLQKPFTPDALLHRVREVLDVRHEE